MPRKGYKQTKEHILKLSEAHKGQTHSAESIKKQILSRKGYTHSVETRRKLSEAHKGKRFSAEHRRKLSLVNKGKKHSIETKRKIGLASKNISDENRKKLSIAGKNMSVEKRKRISEKLKGHTVSKETRIKIGLASVKRICNQKNPMFSNTKPELELKEIFIKNGIKFTHQYFMEDIQHPYAADFYLPDYNCIVEADGKYWHNFPKGNDKDHIRTAEMKTAGYNVLRFWEGQINEEDIINKLNEVIL